MKLEDQGVDVDANPTLLKAEMEEIFKSHYLANLREAPPHVRLESEHFLNQLACMTLISVAQK